MKVLKETKLEGFDVFIFGLGYESRSVSSLQDFEVENKMSYALGYENNTDVLFYQRNKEVFSNKDVKIYEGPDDFVIQKLENALLSDLNNVRNIVVDITVMSRHRLARVLNILLGNCVPGTNLSIVYYPSYFVSPPEDTTPIKKVSAIGPEFSGSLGDLAKPTSLIVGLGYEKNKALGLSVYLDSGSEYLFIPKSSESQFEDFVLKNNDELLSVTPGNRIFYYDIDQPYTTYINLRSLILSLKEHSRPLIVPLGPKILAALSVIITAEFANQIPVWRVSSEHTEIPVERAYSGDRVAMTIKF